MYRRYYSYNDMPTVSKPKQPEKKEEKSVEICEKKESPKTLFENGKLFGKLETDDLILLIVIFVLLADNCDDSLLLLALAFIFLSS